jgi:glycosyltransferase involved in cell wall biosynthesis
MRILYITPTFQHPTMRGPSRHYHLIRELSQRHEVTLLTLTKTKVTPEAKKEMGSYTKQVLTFNAFNQTELAQEMQDRALSKFNRKVKRVLHARESVKRMKQAFKELVQQQSFDVILFHGKDVFSVIEEHDDLPVVVDFCDATSKRILMSLRYAGIAKLPWLLLRYLEVRQIEKKLISKTPHLAFISGRDRDAIMAKSNGVKIVPVGIDLNYWKRRNVEPQPNCLLFIGVMDYAPNEDAARYLINKILPLVKQSCSNLEVLIVGRDPTPALQEQARNCHDVTVTGFVEDIRPYLERAAIFVAPVRFASGVQNKVLEAMAMEVPVVTTSVVADGLRVDGEGEPPVLVADKEKEFAEQILKLLGEQKERSRLAVAGRRFIEQHFVWSRCAETLENMCMAAVGNNGQRHQSTKGEK